MWILAGQLLRQANAADRAWVNSLFVAISMAGDRVDEIPSYLGDHLGLLTAMGERYGIPWDIEITEADTAAIQRTIRDAVDHAKLGS